jgi:hypothetical protein
MNACYSFVNPAHGRGRLPLGIWSRHICVNVMSLLRLQLDGVTRNIIWRDNDGDDEDEDEDDDVQQAKCYTLTQHTSSKPLSYHAISDHNLVLNRHQVT